MKHVNRLVRIGETISWINTRVAGKMVEAQKIYYIIHQKEGRV